MYGFYLNPIAPDCAPFNDVPITSDINLAVEELANPSHPEKNLSKHISLNEAELWNFESRMSMALFSQFVDNKSWIIFMVVFMFWVIL